MDWDAYVLPLRYIYNVQIPNRIKMLFFSMALTRTPPESAVVEPKPVCLASDAYLALLMYATLELIRRETDLRCQADKNLRLAQRPYKKDHDRHHRFVSTIRVGDYNF